jgi:hypothetical protein
MKHAYVTAKLTMFNQLIARVLRKFISIMQYNKYLTLKYCFGLIRYYFFSISLT